MYVEQLLSTQRSFPLVTEFNPFAFSQRPWFSPKPGIGLGYKTLNERQKQEKTERITKTVTLEKLQRDRQAISLP